MAIPGIITYRGRTHENIIDESSQCRIGRVQYVKLRNRLKLEAKIGGSPWSRVNGLLRDMP